MAPHDPCRRGRIPGADARRDSDPRNSPTIGHRADWLLLVEGATPNSASGSPELPAAAAGAFERLRAWRAATAKEQGVPAYVVFHDATLRQIATEEPATLAALGTVSGVGAAKLERYGEGLLAALQG